MKKELLAPVGSMKALYQAIFNGADAVYLGCKNFGARKFATNFTNSEIVAAIKLCHLYGVKIYATMNTLISDEEVNSFLDQIAFLHENGIDAVIVQDFGMICLIREKYPNLEIHASTQANTSAQETAQLFYNLGVKRVVFSRELSLEEIESITVPIEKEVFVHGALCICYSGCCLMSSMIGNRSGNRGECTGCCRLPYSLSHNAKIISTNNYLLSTKELNTSSVFKKLLESDILSFKIEGRMKSPEYVGFITNFYRNLIDHNGNINITEYNEKLKTIFNREFTTGYLFENKPTDILNIKSPNHIGLEIGEVIDITKDKIKLKLTHPLNQQDGIRFLKSQTGFIVNYLYDEKGKMTSSATDICYVDNKVNLKIKDKVAKTQDYKLLESLKSYPLKKIPITITVTSLINKPFTLKITDGIDTVTVEGNLVEKAINSPTTIERINEQLTKLGETPFTCQSINNISDDNIFIPIKSLNDLRREASSKLISIRENKKVNVISQEVTLEKLLSSNNTKGISSSVYNEEQLKACLTLNLNRIYTSNLELYKKYQDFPNVYYKTPRCKKNITENLASKNLVSDYFDFKNKINIGDYGLNAYNSYTVYYLTKLGLKSVTLSVELSSLKINNLLTNYHKLFNSTPNIEVLVYGRVENMIIKGNILNINKNDYKYTLIDSKDHIFPTYFDGEKTHILNYTNTIIEPNEIIKPITYRFDFYDETGAEVKSIINRYLQKIY